MYIIPKKGIEFNEFKNQFWIIKLENSKNKGFNILLAATGVWYYASDAANLWFTWFKCIRYSTVYTSAHTHALF